MRIGGMASGMDTDTLIRDLMNANRIPLNKIVQKKSYLEWQVNDYRTANRQLKDFSTMTFDKMIMSSSFTQKNVNISSPDDVSIKNLSSTSDFSGTLQIHKLAKNAMMTSGKLDKITSEADLKKPLSELGLVPAPSDFTIKSIKKDGTLDDGYEVKISADSTMESVLADINKNSGVNAFYDSFTGQIAFTAKNSGNVKDGNEIEFDGGHGFLKVDANTTLASDAGRGTEGQNAEFTFNGLLTERATNTFQINGFEISLKQVTGDVGAPNGKTITFNSAPDTDKIFDNVVKYIDEYNKLIEDLHSKIREPKYRSFHPLSAEEKKDMSDKEIEQWEEKAMSGTLRNDSTLSSMLSEMRMALTGELEKGGLSLKDIGITTSKDYKENGKLIINEETLKKAINDSPNKVHELFSKDGEKLEDQGFARRLRTIVDKNQKVIGAKAGKIGDGNDAFTLGSSLKDMNKQIDRFEDRMKMVENRLWKQFTAMEQAINRANAQSAQLMSSLGGGM